ncbi:hypothetical protein F4805DRAFT_474859 [Annulohypoxylon moriforme]|nr:hypothetical protein F4805DRAFT_474859 [Annulohypoxylon moriforme]
MISSPHKSTGASPLLYIDYYTIPRSFDFPEQAAHGSFLRSSRAIWPFFYQGRPRILSGSPRDPEGQNSSDRSTSKATTVRAIGFRKIFTVPQIPGLGTNNLRHLQQSVIATGIRAVEAVAGTPPVRHLNQSPSVRAHRAVLCVQHDPAAAMLSTRTPLPKLRKLAALPRSTAISLCHDFCNAKGFVSLDRRVKSRLHLPQLSGLL